MKEELDEEGLNLMARIAIRIGWIRQLEGDLYQKPGGLDCSWQ
jgi:hypothetical protein